MAALHAFRTRVPLVESAFSVDLRMTKHQNEIAPMKLPRSLTECMNAGCQVEEEEQGKRRRVIRPSSEHRSRSAACWGTTASGTFEE